MLCVSDIKMCRLR